MKESKACTQHASKHGGTQRGGRGGGGGGLSLCSYARGESPSLSSLLSSRIEIVDLRREREKEEKGGRDKCECEAEGGREGGRLSPARHRRYRGGRVGWWVGPEESVLGCVDAAVGSAHKRERAAAAAAACRSWGSVRRRRRRRRSDARSVPLFLSFLPPLYVVGIHWRRSSDRGKNEFRAAAAIPKVRKCFKSVQCW